MAKQRNCTVHTTKGERRKVVATAGETWGHLKKELSEAGVDMTNMRAVLKETRHTLDNSKAILPKEDFSIVLLQVKHRAGTDPKDMSYKELRTELKRICNGAQEETARKHFGNYTQMSTDSMRKKLKSWQRRAAKNTAQGGKMAPAEDVSMSTLTDQDEEVSSPVIDQLDRFAGAFGKLRDLAVKEVAYASRMRKREEERMQIEEIRREEEAKMDAEHQAEIDEIVKEIASEYKDVIM